ncbi:hypothetical protein CQW23_10969 [Capsicum baccatum]|uniref:Uncharacterized protein n=1 Tax=Capsicum baccatum TaxID=33114 RepID=A0A2G2X153_CAPBA|nr:hypothetical protein CQW23_10969 [Capsicum baccatum]
MKMRVMAESEEQGDSDGGGSDNNNYYEEGSGGDIDGEDDSIRKDEARGSSDGDMKEVTIASDDLKNEEAIEEGGVEWHRKIGVEIKLWISSELGTRSGGEAEIVRQEFYTKRRKWEREKEELQRQVFELQLDVQGMGDHLTVAAKRQTRLALIEDEKPFGDREDTTKFVQCEAEDGSSKVFQNLYFRPFQVKSETKLPIPTSRNKSIFDAVGIVSSKLVFQVSQSLKRKYHIIRERRIHYAKEQKNKPVQD